MKSLKIMILSVIMTLLPVTTINAQYSVREYDNLPATTDETLFSNRSRLIRSLNNLKNMSQFRMNMQLVNRRSNEVRGEVTILGNQQTGDAIIDIAFYNRLAQPSEQTIRLYTYDHFKYAYANVLDWLNQQDYFKQPYFKASDDELMRQYNHLFVEMNQSAITLNESSSDLLSSLLLIPTEKQLQLIDEQAVYYIAPIYTINLDRIEIPEAILTELSLWQLDYQLTASEQHNQLSLAQSLKLNQKANALSFMTQLEQNINQNWLFPNEDLLSDRTLPTLTVEQQISNQLVTDKLTDFDLAYNQKIQRYQLTLGGITENFNLNLFEDKTAQFKSYEFKTIYTIEPASFEMPPLLALDTVSQQELNYLLSQTITKGVH